jgi:NAD(P)H-dependent FMN reductase
MYTLICATHRPGNKTLGVLRSYRNIIEKKGISVVELDMSDLPDSFISSDGFGKRTEAVDKLISEKLSQSEKLVIVAPEYNGSFPGIFKTFIDAVDPKIFRGKKAALVGVASGRAGNLRGLDHLTDIMHHLQVEVLSLKVPISKLEEMLDENGAVANAEILDALNKQAQMLIDF